MKTTQYQQSRQIQFDKILTRLTKKVCATLLLTTVMLTGSFQAQSVTVRLDVKAGEHQFINKFCIASGADGNCVFYQDFPVDIWTTAGIDPGGKVTTSARVNNHYSLSNFGRLEIYNTFNQTAGYLENGDGGTIVNRGDFLNNGVFDNDGRFFSFNSGSNFREIKNTGDFYNEGSFLNQGTFNNLEGTLTNTAKGTWINLNQLTNNATLINQGHIVNLGRIIHDIPYSEVPPVFSIEKGAALSGDGTLVVKGTALTVDGSLAQKSIQFDQAFRPGVNILSGTGRIEGAVEINAELLLKDNPSGALSLAGTVINNSKLDILGDVINGGFVGLPTTFTNNGEMTVHGTSDFINNAFFLNKKSTNYTPNSLTIAGEFVNNLVLDNQDTLVTTADSKVTNNGQVLNSGSINIASQFGGSGTYRQTSGSLWIAEGGSLSQSGIDIQGGEFSGEGEINSLVEVTGNTQISSNPTKTLKLNAGLTNNAILDINGGLTNESGTLINNHTINSNRFMRNNGELINNGELNNNGSIISSGEKTNSKGATFNNAKDARFNNAGQFTNEGTINNAGVIFNNVLLDNYGTLINHRELLNGFSAILNNHGILINKDTFVVSGGTTLNNTRILTNDKQLRTFGTINNSGTLTNGINGELNNIGDIINKRLIINNGTFTNRGESTLHNAPRGQFVNSGAFSNEGTVVNSERFFNNNTIENTGTFTNSGDLENRSSSVFNNQGTLTNNALLAVDDGARLNNNASLSNNNVMVNLGQFNNFSDFSNSERAKLFNSGTLTNEGTITNSGLIDNRGVIENSGTVHLSNESAVIGSGSFIQTDGDLIVNGRLSQRKTDILGGTLKGSGVINGDVNVKNAAISPGNSAGTLIFMDDLTVSDFSVINVELAGVEAGVDYDQLNVFGVASFDATTVFNINFIDGFFAQSGDIFDLVIADSFSFTDLLGFNFNYTGSTLAAGLEWVSSLFILDNGRQSLRLTVNSTLSDPSGPTSVSEPSVIILFASGFLILLVRRRCRI